MARYFLTCAMEQFPPGELVAQAVAGEAAGFDGICCSDHFQPWWEPGESGQAWVWLGAVGQATERVQLGSAVTAPVHRYHPALVAQAFATLEAMFPGRAFLGVGSGESLNETPLGMDYPDTAEQLARLEEALELIGRLFDGERVTGDGFFPTKDAFLHTRPERRPPVWVSAFHEGAARVAGRLGDGLWTLADPETTPGLIAAYREGCDEVGKEPGEILLQTSFSWAETDEAAFAGAQVWKAGLVDEFYTDDWHDPREMQRHAQATISDEEFLDAFIVGADLDEHVRRIREVEELGATTVVLMNVSGSAPLEAVERYGRDVLPRLRG
ncbi:MAG: TIGR03557 family F420-dependent LLM class oxidoreductase [Actinobacteria bacterium]|nr:TIGR03557 family F420-dependent LLM class oxidoreductase [Actinomycetota bacterium]